MKNGHKKTAAEAAVFEQQKRELNRLDCCSLLAFGAHLHVEVDLLALLQRLEAASLNFGEMREQVFAAIIGSDEAEALRIVEPLNCTCCHAEIP